MLVAEVTTPVPSRSSDPTNHKGEKLPTVPARLRYWLGELALTNAINQLRISRRGLSLFELVPSIGFAIVFLGDRKC